MNNIFSGKYTLPLSVGIVALVLIVGGAFAWSQVNQNAESQPTPPPASSPTPTSKETLVVNEELKDVSFCGRTYQTKQLYINDVNVIQKIAEIASEDMETLICENIDRNASSDILDTTYELFDYPSQINEIYVITLNSLGFMINVDTGIIAIIGAFDNTVIGLLKD